MNDITIRPLMDLRISMGQTEGGQMVLNFAGIRYVPGGHEELTTHEVMALVLRAMDQWHCAEHAKEQTGPKLQIATGGLIN